MTTIETDADKVLPQHQGSPEALAILHAMADWRMPISNSEIAALTELSNKAVTRALEGLKERGMVVPEGTRRHATWMLAHLHRQQEKERTPC